MYRYSEIAQVVLAFSVKHLKITVAMVTVTVVKMSFVAKVTDFFQSACY